MSGTGESSPPEGIERWDFFGNPSDFTSGPVGIPYFAGTSNAGVSGPSDDAGDDGYSGERLAAMPKATQ